MKLYSSNQSPVMTHEILDCHACCDDVQSSLRMSAFCSNSFFSQFNIRFSKNFASEIKLNFSFVYNKIDKISKTTTANDVDDDRNYTYSSCHFLLSLCAQRSFSVLSLFLSLIAFNSRIQSLQFNEMKTFLVLDSAMHIGNL